MGNGLFSGDGNSDGSYDVYIQDQTTDDISLFLAAPLDEAVTLSTNTTINDETITATFPNVTPTVGKFLCFKEGVRFYQAEITSVTLVSGNEYTCGIAMPLDFAFTTNATVCLQSCDMNINGATTPTDFFVTPGALDAGEKWHITRMMISMTHDAASDDGLFAGIARLTKGVYFRTVDGTIKNLFNFRDGTDIRLEAFDVVYPPRSNPVTGSFGTSARISFNGQDKRGVVKKLEADSVDKFLAHVRDNISVAAGVKSFRVKVQGHVVE